jgi:hypothetical protein
LLAQPVAFTPAPQAGLRSTYGDTPLSFMLFVWAKL